MISFTADQIFLVTGASSGLGEGVALLLNKLGATVVGIARNAERLDAMHNKCKHPENCFTEIKDLTKDIDGLSEYVKDLKNKYGKFRGLAICHGIAAVRPAQLVSYDSIKTIFDCNYFAPVMLAKGFVDRRNNTGRGSAVVAISSLAANAFPKGLVEYAGSKAALRASMTCLAQEVVTSGIRVNTVLPADIKTPMNLSEVSQIRGKDWEKHYPLGFGEVSDVANMVVFLLSDAAKWITAQSYVIDCRFE